MRSRPARRSRSRPRGARRDAALEHFDICSALLGARAGLRHARKHLAAYAEKAGATAGATGCALVTSDEPAEARRLLAAAFADPNCEAAA